MEKVQKYLRIIVILEITKLLFSVVKFIIDDGLEEIDDEDD